MRRIMQVSMAARPRVAMAGVSSSVRSARSSTSSKWVQLPVARPADLKPLLPSVRTSYEASGP